MQEYKVEKVSQQEPKKWEGQNGTVYYIKTKLEGHEKPVSIGKKTPDALKAGDTVYGEIIETDYIEDKFKAGKKPFTPNGGYNDPDKQAQIKAQWAIGQAVQIEIALYTANKNIDSKRIEETAGSLYSMVDRVKAGEQPKKDWVDPSIRQKLEEAKQTNDGLDEDMRNLIDSEEPINLSEIPF